VPTNRDAGKPGTASERANQTLTTHRWIRKCSAAQDLTYRLCAAEHLSSLKYPYLAETVELVTPPRLDWTITEVI
jgi:hypothetical protein